MENRTITATQGSQLTFAAARVGIMRVGARDGRTVAQLALRSPSTQDVIVVSPGDTIDLRDSGLLRIDRIDAVEGSTRGDVTFTHTTADPATP